MSDYKKVKQEKKLLAENYMKLLSTQERLILDSGLTLEERITKLKRTNPDADIYPKQLCMYFQKHKIKRKFIKECYPRVNKHSHRYNERFLEVKEELMRAKRQGRRIVYF